MTTNQTTIDEAPGKLQTVTGNARQAVTTARTKTTDAVRRNPKKSATATTLVLAAAAAAAVLLTRRRSAKVAARGRNRLAGFLTR